jgi:hypothetical protein
VAGWTGALSGGAGLGGRVADSVVPQGFPLELPGPVDGQVQHGFAGGGREASRDVDQVTAQVAPRAMEWSVPARTPAARSRLWAITAAASQAQFAANSPDFIWSDTRLSATCMTDVGNPGFRVVDAITFCCPSRKRDSGRCELRVQRVVMPETESNRGRCSVRTSCRSNRWSGSWRKWRRSRSRRTRSRPMPTI